MHSVCTANAVHTQRLAIALQGFQGFGLGAMMLGFEITSMILTSCQTHSVVRVTHHLSSLCTAYTAECWLGAVSITCAHVRSAYEAYAVL